ncbi:MAG TPA: VTT domain-containing protein [Pyrinomonadaceae bacterium]|nr:VTT domain-containing protein [Pyrinomonadaceae bacterium]
MTLISGKIGHALARLSEYFIALGPFGLFAVALLDSTFVPLPSSVDALMIILTTAHPRMMIAYAFLATAGSTTGCLILYYVSRRTGSRALKRFSPSKQARAKDLIERYDILSVLVASLMPPPFPFKIFVISAGVFRFNVIRFGIAIFAGRLFRFLLEGYLAIRYGAQAKEVLARNYPWIGLGLAIAIVAFFVTRNLLKRKSAANTENLEPGNQGQEL